METLFDIVYLVSVITIGLMMILAAKETASSVYLVVWRWCWAQAMRSI